MRLRTRPLGALLLIVLLSSLSGCSLFFSAPREGEVVRYTIQRGDTLYELALRYHTNVDEILRSNPGLSPRALEVGQTIVIRAGERRNPGQRRPAPAVHEGRSGVLGKVPLGRAQRYVGKLLWPVRDGALSSRFGYRWASFHEGIDIVRREGAPIYAAHDGEVIYSAAGLRGYGNMIVLRGDDLLTIYSHNRRNLVRVGARVNRGEQIAELGKSGKATGPHLHFETRVKDKDGKFVAIDPLTFYPQVRFKEQ